MTTIDPVHRAAVLENARRQLLKINERESCERDLRKFLENGWKYIDPAPFIGGWHLDAIAEHLMAVTDGEIQRLIINVPPRTSKSSITSVAWPAWTWAQEEKGPCSGPQVQFLSASYAYTLSLRDSVKTRRLIESAWYQKHWGERYRMTGDVNTKGRFENDKGGYRLATSVDGTTTGEGGQIILVDDAHSATEVESDLVRTNTLQWWAEAMSTRLNNPETGAYVVIMQRLHQEDLTGYILSKDDGWTHLMLPMEYEPARHCITYIKGEKFWEDPRSEEGELLCPDRFNQEQVVALKKRMPVFSVAGQLQQAPVPRGGGIIKEEWWQKWKHPKYPPCEFVLASLDTAYTEKTENDASALTIWGYFRHDPTVAVPTWLERLQGDAKKQALSSFYTNVPPKIILLYGWQDRLSIHDLVTKVIDSCTTDRREVKVKHRFPVDKLLIESKASGISVAQEIHRLAGFKGQFGVELFDPRKYGDKQARVYAIQHLFSEGLIYVPWPEDKDGQESEPYMWAEEIIDEITIFPRGSHDDIVDSMSMAMRWMRDFGFARSSEEHAIEVAQEVEYRGRPAPLYPV